LKWFLETTNRKIHINAMNEYKIEGLPYNKDVLKQEMNDINECLSTDFGLPDGEF
jgi:hypothetical protein